MLDEEGTSFLNDLDNLPEGITVESESAPNGESSPNTRSLFLVARGPKCADEDAECVSAQVKLQRYVEQLELEDQQNAGDSRRFADHQLVVSELSAQDDAADREVEEEAWRTFYVYRSSDVTGEDVDDAFTSFDPQEGNRPVVSIQFNAAGAVKFEEMTGRNVKRRMAIVLDDVAASAPVIQTRIGGGRAQITLGSGDFDQIRTEANDLVVVLRAGALPAPLRPANEQLIGPTLGRDSGQQGRAREPSSASFSSSSSWASTTRSRVWSRT